MKTNKEIYIYQLIIIIIILILSRRIWFLRIENNEQFKQTEEQSQQIEELYIFSYNVCEELNMGYCSP